MIWRWVWRTVALFVGRRLWAAWQRRRHGDEPAYPASTSGPHSSGR